MHLGPRLLNWAEPGTNYREYLLSYLLAWRHVIILLSDTKTISREAANKIIKLGKSIKVINKGNVEITASLLQSSLYPLDSGYSEWLGYVLKMINTAQLQLLKLNYQVSITSTTYIYEFSTFNF